MDKVSLLEYLVRPVKIYVWLTLLNSLINLKWKNNIHRSVLFILICSGLTEVVNSFLKYHNVTIGLSSNINVIITFILWLRLLSTCLFRNKSVIIVILFSAISLYNLFFGEGIEKFNFYTFIIGAFLYIILFIYGSFYQLNKENFSFFNSNDYVILFAPVLFFFGLSFIFGFQSADLADTIILGDIKLYDFIIYFVNIIYYTLINIYIYREKKLNHA